MKTNQLLIAIIFSVSLLVSVYFITNTINNRNAAKNVIEVTGIAERDIESDLIVWNAKLTIKNNDLISGYAQMKAKSIEIDSFLTSQGIAKTDINLLGVEVIDESDPKPAINGPKSKTKSSYSLSQTITISSKEIAKAENAIKRMPEIISEGTQIISYTPEYYFTRLTDLKLSLLANASRDGLLRAKAIADNGGASIGKLVNSTMGAFQIANQNTTDKNCSVKNITTTSRMKTISISVKMKYQLK